MAHKDRVRGIAIHRPIIYGNVAHVIPTAERASDHTHRWTVAVRSAASNPAPSASPTNTPQLGGADSLSHFIKRVTFKLHSSYANSSRNVEKEPFEVTETGWGEFEIAIKIFFTPDSGEKPLAFTHHLKLHPWKILDDVEDKAAELLPPPKEPMLVQGEAAPPFPDPPPAPGPQQTADMMDVATDPEANLLLVPASPPPEPEVLPPPVHSWQYDELIFTSPTSTFYTLLLSLPPTPLPVSSAYPGPERLGKHKDVGGEWSVELEESEGRRLEWGKMKVVGEIEKWRQRLIEKEAELAALKREIGELEAAKS